MERLAAPVDPRPDDPAEPEEILPQAVRQRVAPVRKQGPTRKPRPGDLICGECGEGNHPPRRFCHRCGTSLAQAETVRLPWRKRVFLFMGRTKVKKAGTRPRKRGSAGGSKGLVRKFFYKVQAIAFIVAILGGVLFAVHPPFRTFVVSKVQAAKEAVVRLLPSPESPTRPAAVEASAAQAEHPVRHAFDIATNTYWAAAWPGEGRPKVRVDLGKHVALRKVIITAGVSNDFDGYLRPARLHLTYSNERSESIIVQDTPEPQEIALQAGLGVNTLTIEVLDVHQAAKVSEVAITEIEFFGVG